jgi:hypothetical protein
MTQVNDQTDHEVLRAGDLCLRLVGSDVRSATWQGTEVLQRAYYAVRDAPWNTVPGIIEERSIDQRTDGFSALIRQHHSFDEIVLRCDMAIAGDVDGKLVIRATTVAESAFSYSKIGLNLHHGLRTYRGVSGRARTLDGWTSFRLDDEIEPQLIRDGTLTAMFAHFDALEVALPGLAVRFDFAGDRFEMQDHRNWCDANWKTYGTPLEYGFPMDCAAGQRFEQTVTISVTETSSPPPASRRSPVTAAGEVEIALGDVDGALPSIGVDASAALPPAKILETVRPAFLRVTIDAGTTAAAGHQQLVALNTPVEAVVHLDGDDPGSAQRSVEAVAGSGLAVLRVMCMVGAGEFSAFRGATPTDVVDAWLAASAGTPLAHVPVFAGASQSYNVIARDRPQYGDGVGIVFAANPQVHACDDESVMENAAAFADVVRDCRRLYPGRQVAISPVQLISDNGPFPGGPPVSPSDRPQDDPRYDTEFAAAWSIAVLAAVSGEALEAICLFDAAGPRGLARADGTVKPVGNIVGQITGRGGEPTRTAFTSDPHGVAVLDVGEGSRRTVLIANLRPVHRQARVDGWPGNAGTVPLEPYGGAVLR